MRPSGTEPLVRVMAEATTQDECDAVCDRIVAVVARVSRLTAGSPAAVAAAGWGRMAATTLEVTTLQT